MKRKVGDEVQVKSLDWYNTNKNKDGNVPTGGQSFTEDMSKFCGTIVTIKKVINSYYLIKEDDFGWYFTDEMFEECVCLNKLCYDENNIQIIDITPLKQQKIIWTESAPDTTELVIGKNYELVMDGGVYKVIKKKPKYPKTYEECCDILDIRCDENEYTQYYKCDLIDIFIKILICRDAYWEIAGEEMGLDKPWDSTYGCGEWGYWIGYDINENKIYLQDSRILVNHILVFPTKEMRDAFYENFKELIETVKELL